MHAKGKATSMLNMFRKMTSAAILHVRGEEVSRAAARAGAAWLCSLECMHDAAQFFGDGLFVAPVAGVFLNQHYHLCPAPV